MLTGSGMSKSSTVALNGDAGDADVHVVGTTRD